MLSLSSGNTKIIEVLYILHESPTLNVRFHIYFWLLKRRKTFASYVGHVKRVQNFYSDTGSPFN